MRENMRLLALLALLGVVLAQVNYRGTTDPSIPNTFKTVLNRLAHVDEAAEDHYGAEPAVATLEQQCGWDPAKSDFVHPDCLDAVGLSLQPKKLHNFNAPVSDVHIVVPSIRDLDFLNKWKSVLYPYDFIIVQDGDPAKRLQVPSWVSYELFNRNDIEKTLGQHSWIISSQDASIRNFGFLVSNRTYIYTLDDDCTPAPDPKCDNGGSCHFVVNALGRHLRNLMTPSTPDFFNTLYDPYLPGSDFVRGYPYSMRSGVPTVISHGLWMNAPDYDAPTQLLKVKERNKRYIETTITIPRGTFYPMCSMNVAFNRKLIGAAFMQGLMGEGMPWARYDDMFAGWASKACADHLGFGVKSGDPYILHNKASNPFTNLKKEYMGLFWQEDLIAFFKSLQLSAHADDAEKCYLELADKIQDRFGKTHPYFHRLAKAMRIWIHLWRQRSANKLHFHQCQRSAGVPRATGRQRSAAVFTIVRNEPVNLPIWLRYYTRHFDANDIYIIDNGANDDVATTWTVNVVKKPTHHYFDHAALVTIVQDFQKSLLEKYEYVLFAEADEIVVPVASKYSGGIREYIDRMNVDTVLVTAYDIVHQPNVEDGIDTTHEVLYQRQAFYRHPLYDKPLLTKSPVLYGAGFHRCINCSAQIDPDLLMIHLHRMDMDICVSKHEWKARQTFPSGEPEGLGRQHHIVGPEASAYCSGNSSKNLQERQNVLDMLTGLPAEF
jgi:reversibly glycosylated polypeptide / UDP-arabinopyranose mutase